MPVSKTDKQTKDINDTATVDLATDRLSSFVLSTKLTYLYVNFMCIGYSDILSESG